MHVRRSAIGAALVLPLALTGLATTAATGATERAPEAAKAAPTTGRLITSDKPGIVLVDETGKRSKVLVDARGKHADLAQINVTTGTFLWSTTPGKKTTWHVSNLYGAQIGDFTLPQGASEPSIDSGGYEYWWIRPGTGTTPAAVMAYEFQNPLATPRVVKELVPGSASGLWLSPDDQWLVTEVTGASGTSLHVVSTDGKTSRTVPVPAGTTLAGGRVVWSPDSGQVAFLAGAAGATPSVYVAPVAGDYAPIKLAAAAQALYDWSPDGAGILTGTPGSRELSEVSATTGAAVKALNIKRAPKDASVLWTGLKAGKFPRDKIRPKIAIAQPDCGKRKGAACTSYRSSVQAWRTITGPVSDKGLSQLRYVAVAVFQKRADGWWALVGNGKHPIWKKFPNYVEARYTAKERTSQIIGKRYQVKVPGLKAGKLYIVAKARDGAGNDTAVKRQVVVK
jgi:hypothetical protein